MKLQRVRVQRNSSEKYLQEEGRRGESVKKKESQLGLEELQTLPYLLILVLVCKLLLVIFCCLILSRHAAIIPDIMLVYISKITYLCIEALIFISIQCTPTNSKM